MADFPEQPAVFIPNKRPISAKFAVHAGGMVSLPPRNSRLKPVISRRAMFADTGQYFKREAEMISSRHLAKNGSVSSGF